MSGGAGGGIGGRWDDGAAGVVVTQCVLCRHRVRGRCPAFPGGVPDSIILNQFDHRRPYPGQARPDVVFAPRDGADPAALRRLYGTLDALARARHPRFPFLP